MIGMAVSRIATRIERRQQLRTKIDVFLSGAVVWAEGVYSAITFDPANTYTTVLTGDH